MTNINIFDIDTLKVIIKTQVSSIIMSVLDQPIGDLIQSGLSTISSVRTPQLIGLIQGLFNTIITALLTVIAKIIALIIVKMIINLLRSLDITKTFVNDKDFNFYDVDTTVNNVQSVQRQYPGYPMMPMIHIQHADVYQPSTGHVYPPTRHVYSPPVQLQPYYPGLNGFYQDGGFSSDDDGLLQNFLLLDIL